MLPTEPAEGGDPATYPSAVVVSHDGRFLWTANRGHDSISVLALDTTGEQATLVTTVDCGGHWPRDLALDPTGHAAVRGQRAVLRRHLVRHRPGDRHPASRGLAGCPRRVLPDLRLTPRHAQHDRRTGPENRARPAIMDRRAAGRTRHRVSAPGHPAAQRA